MSSALNSERYGNLKLCCLLQQTYYEKKSQFSELSNKVITKINCITNIICNYEMCHYLV